MKRFLLAAGLLVSSGMSCVAQTACDPILKWGIWNKEKIHNTNFDFKQTQFYVCNSTAQTADSLKSGAASVGIDLGGVLGINAGGAAATTNYQDWRSNFCATNIDTIQNNNQLIKEIETASATITNAWAKCTEHGFFGWVSPTPDPGVFKIGLEYKTSGPNHVRLLNFSVEPRQVKASCQPRIRTDADLFEGSKEWICRRDQPGATAVAIVVNSDQGPVNAELPAFVANPPAPSTPSPPCTANNVAGQCLRCEFDLRNFQHLHVDGSVPYTCAGMPPGTLVDIYLSGNSTIDGTGIFGTWVNYKLVGPNIILSATAAGAPINPFVIAGQGSAPQDGVMTLKLYNAYDQNSDGTPEHRNLPASITEGSLVVRVIPAPASAISRSVLERARATTQSQH